MAVKEIKKAAVLGAGVMGATIAAHLANVGIPVYLLDIVPRELTPEEEKKGLTLESPEVRNRLATLGKEGLLKQKLNPLYRKSNVELIIPGNMEDHMDWLKECDWIIEVVIENMDIKKNLFKRVEAHWTPGTIVSSNTSGLSINEMVSECSAEFRKYFLGTHFFNPPRYMKLLELIPCSETLPEVMSYMQRFCERVLGKGVVFAKDTPNFIANRIGTYAMVQTMKLMQQEKMTIEQVDAITGPPMGHPKSASFRTMDMVGLDTFCHVVRTSIEKSPDPVEKEEMQIPAFLERMVEQKLLGDKTGQGFYKKVRGEGGKEIFAIDYETLEYRPREKAKFDILKKAKDAGLREGFKLLVNSDDQAGRFAWNLTKKLLLYTARRIPEIADDIVNIDRAMSWGFNWELGPFASWDAIGLRESVERMKKEGEEIPAFVEEMLNNGCESFYKEDENGTLYYYDIPTKSYKPVPISPEVISLPALKKQNRLVKGNDDGSLIDLGDGVCCLEMHSPQQAISPLFTQFIFEAIEEAEKNFAGMIIANQAKNFCVGANVALLLMAAQSGDWDMIEKSVKEFQDAMLAIKYSRIPVVAAPFQMTLGGGMEIILHCDRIHAAAETYMGQVEMGVGLLPGGGGNKELLYRYLERIPEGMKVDLLPYVQKAFEAIAMATVSTSARHAQELGFMRPTDKVSVNQDHLIHDAKQTVLTMIKEGYEPPRPKEIPALGEYGFAAFKAGVQNMRWGNYISDHDMKIALEIAYVLCGGNIRPMTMVSEQYLLDLEREAFLRLLGEEKTQERIMSLLTTGRPVRN
ncbi:MAG: 3-hydroxyacyl-CoA dehydrogenase/enoyl-CoA hydratase family protein [Firmicutes bacterium]|jgi:3-hydroxyacyl-CoA dehydrogenase|nr:3-hydroxyacyl-CoA dehydrogenase/enoyl-CoA hydratase family protein [Bacillota bacterium]HPU01296.1 3-hydroxyacyl-CoA dehydrogenase/enoyl-CoA hydratase family protein [Bacillota bacterium]